MILKGKRTELIDVEISEVEIIRSLRKIFEISEDLVYDEKEDKFYEIVEEWYGSHSSIKKKEYEFSSNKERDMAKYVLGLESLYPVL